MKSLNTMKYVTNMTIDIAEYMAAVRTAETYEAAKNVAKHILGYIGCAITFLNTMVCTENNDFTAEFDEVIDEWQGGLYQLLIDKAIETSQPADVVLALCQKRDEYAS